MRKDLFGSIQGVQPFLHAQCLHVALGSCVGWEARCLVHQKLLVDVRRHVGLRTEHDVRGRLEQVVFGLLELHISAHFGL